MLFRSGNALYRIDAQTGEVTTLVLSEPGRYYWNSFEWSPDGKGLLLAYADRDARENRLVRRDLETGQETVLYRSPRSTLSSPYSYFAVSHDGRNIALGGLAQSTEPARTTAVALLNETRSHVLSAMPAAGGEPHELVQFQEQGSAARFHRYDWTADGRYLVYAKGNPQDHKAELWRIAADGGNPQKLDLVVEGLRALHMHPDGQRIAFSTGKTIGGSELWVMENFLPSLSAKR